MVVEKVRFVCLEPVGQVSLRGVEVVPRHHCQLPRGKLSWKLKLEDRSELWDIGDAGREEETPEGLVRFRHYFLNIMRRKAV